MIYNWVGNQILKKTSKLCQFLEGGSIQRELAVLFFF